MKFDGFRGGLHIRLVNLVGSNKSSSMHKRKIKDMFLSTVLHPQNTILMSILQLGKRHFDCHDLPSLQCLTSSPELRGEGSECSRVQLEASS